MKRNDTSHIVFYSVAEEVVNSLSHGIGALLSIAGLVILVVLASLYGNSWHVVSFSIYGSTLIVLYAASTLYHSIPQPTLKKIFMKLDHAAIFLLIAGTYTPFVLVSLRGAWGWTLFGIVWAMAIAGVAMKSIAIFKFRKASVVVYLVMGWLGLVAFRELVSAVPLHGLTLLFMGGLAYSAGVIFYACRRIPFNHGIWHAFVLCGSVLHFFSVLSILPPH